MAPDIERTNIAPLLGAGQGRVIGGVIAAAERAPVAGLLVRRRTGDARQLLRQGEIFPPIETHRYSSVMASCPWARRLASSHQACWNCRNRRNASSGGSVGLIA